MYAQPGAIVCNSTRTVRTVRTVGEQSEQFDKFVPGRRLAPRPRRHQHHREKTAPHAHATLALLCPAPAVPTWGGSPPRGGLPKGIGRVAGNCPTTGLPSRPDTTNATSQTSRHLDGSRVVIFSYGVIFSACLCPPWCVLFGPFPRQMFPP